MWKEQQEQLFENQVNIVSYLTFTCYASLGEVFIHEKIKGPARKRNICKFK